MNNSFRQIPIFVWELAIVICSGIWKAWILTQDVIGFNSDEAIVALMARHILNGSRPIFFYGQAYMGSLDLFLIAPFFSIFGEQVWVIRFVQLILYLFVVFTSIRLARILFKSDKVGLWAGVLLIFPTINMTLYSTASLGGYNEALLIGNLILLSATIIKKKIQEDQECRLGFWLFILFFWIGIGLWVLGITILYAIPAFIIILPAIKFKHHDFINRFSFSIIGFVFGIIPILLFIHQSSGQSLLAELFGSAVNVESEGFFLRSINHLVYFLLFGVPVWFGIRPPWTAQWLAIIFVPIILSIYICVLFYSTRKVLFKNGEFSGQAICLGFIGLFAVGFICTSFGADPSGRYFLPVTIILYFLTGNFLQNNIQSNRNRLLIIGAIMFFQVVSTLQCINRYPPGITTQFYPLAQIDHRYDNQLIEFLENQGEYQGFSNYWVSYPLAFLT